MNSDEELVRILDQAFSSFRGRLDQIEDRLTKIEQRGNALLQERHVIEEPKLLGGKSVGTSASGIERLVMVPVCDVCGERIRLDDEGFSACPRCRRKCCNNGSCLVSYNGIHLCSICLRETLPLSKKAYKVLLALSQKVFEIKTIANLSGIKKEEVRSTIDQLRNRGLIMRQGVIPFSVDKLAEDGHVALTAYRPLYGVDDDTVTYEDELRNHSTEKQEVSTD